MRLLKHLIIPVIVAAVVPAIALAPPPGFPPVVATQPLTGPAAVTIRFTAPVGADVGFQIDAEWSRTVLQGDGVWLFHGDGRPVLIGVSTIIYDRPPQLHVEVPDPIGVLVDRPFARSRASGYSALVLSGVEAGEYVAVVGTAGDGMLDDGAVSLLGSTGVQLVSMTAGAGGFAYLDDDFRGLNVSAATPLGRPLVAAAASAKATLEEGLYGWFAGPFTGVSSLTVDGPGGSVQSNDHVFLGSPPGRYTFTMDLVLGLSSPAWSWGLDAPPVLVAG